MNGQMEREKQIDEISKLICTYPQCVNYNIIGGCKIAECQIVDIAEKLYKQGYRKETQGEWISVEDSLPEKYETVLVFINTENYSFISTDFIWPSGKWYDQNTDVTHWMPLPQPPKMKGAE